MMELSRVSLSSSVLGPTSKLVWHTCKGATVFCEDTGTLCRSLEIFVGVISQLPVPCVFAAAILSSTGDTRLSDAIDSDSAAGFDNDSCVFGEILVVVPKSAWKESCFLIRKLTASKSPYSCMPAKKIVFKARVDYLHDSVNVCRIIACFKANQ